MPTPLPLPLVKRFPWWCREVVPYPPGLSVADEGWQAETIRERRTPVGAVTTKGRPVRPLFSHVPGFVLLMATAHRDRRFGKYVTNAVGFH